MACASPAPFSAPSRGKVPRVRPVASFRRAAAVAGARLRALAAADHVTENQERVCCVVAPVRSLLLPFAFLISDASPAGASVAPAQPANGQPNDHYPLVDEAPLIDPAPMVKVANEHRARLGLRPLELRESLVRSVRLKAADVSNDGAIGHDLVGREIEERAADRGIPAELHVAENLTGAGGAGDADQTLALTLAEMVKPPRHRAHLQHPDALWTGVGGVELPDGLADRFIVVGGARRLSS